MKIFKNADIYAPRHLGVKDILAEQNRIVRIADHIDEYDGLPDAEIIDLAGAVTVPGYVDNHEHITGGGGEAGPATRVPEATAGQLFSCGVTSVIGLLGTDFVTRSPEALLAKARGLEAEGVSVWVLTGGYGYPARTVTGSVESDIILIEKMIGVKTSMSDHRSSNPDGAALLDLATQARRAGMLSGCAGKVTIHTGSGRKKLQPLFDAVEESDVPASQFLPTHIGRTEELFQDGLKFIAMGGTIDITSGVTDAAQHATAEKLARYLQKDPEGAHMTMSSDAFGSSPRFNEKMECIGLTYARPESLHKVVQILVREHSVPLEKALAFITSNPADFFKLEGKGRIEPGSFCDFVVYDDRMEIRQVIAGGKKAVWDGTLLMKGTFEE